MLRSLVAIVLLFASSAYMPAPANKIARSVVLLDSKKAWPGNRPPATNPLFEEQKMDAAWGRGKFRTEIWEDKVNPLNDWWEAYAPTQEEIEAAEAGFDFQDPEGWCKAQGIDYETAKAAAKQETKRQLDELRAGDKVFSLDEFKAAQKEYFQMQKKFFEFAFRLDDDEKQKAKGQPSLTNEDTGYQWKNDE